MKDIKQEKEAFGKNITLLMKERGINKKTFSEITGFDQKSVSAWCRGQRLPSIEKFLVISDFFGYGIDKLLGRDKDVSKSERLERDIEGYIRITGHSRKAAIWNLKYKNIVFGGKRR